MKTWHEIQHLETHWRQGSFFVSKNNLRKKEKRFFIYTKVLKACFFFLSSITCKRKKKSIVLFVNSGLKPSKCTLFLNTWWKDFSLIPTKLFIWITLLTECGLWWICRLLRCDSQRCRQARSKQNSLKSKAFKKTSLFLVVEFWKWINIF